MHMYAGVQDVGRCGTRGGKERRTGIRGRGAGKLATGSLGVDELAGEALEELCRMFVIILCGHHAHGNADSPGETWQYAVDRGSVKLR